MTSIPSQTLEPLVAKDGAGMPNEEVEKSSGSRLLPGPSASSPKVASKVSTQCALDKEERDIKKKEEQLAKERRIMMVSC